MTDRTVPTEPTWKTVPTEATTAQLKAGQDAWHNDPLRLSSTLYRAMVAASPAAPGAEVEPVAKIVYREMGFDPAYATVNAHGEPYGAWAQAIRTAKALVEHLSPPTTDAIKAQARREASRRQAKNYVGGFANEHVPLVTSSIDACVALIEKVLPDWTAWELLSRGGKTRFFVQISKLGPDDEEIYADGRGPTPPIALLGALLSALIAKEEGGV